MTAEARPATQWEGRPVSDWAAAWAVPELLVYEVVSSTNDVARSRAEHGAPAGLTVLSDHQSAGRGRMGRVWQDRPRSSVLLSFLIRPSDTRSPGTAPLRAGMAVASALRCATGADVRLKWPNDLVTPAGKLGGVLCEAVNAGARGGFIIAGIGINVHPQPAHADYPTTSLAEGSDRPITRAEVAEALVRALLPLRHMALQPLSAEDLRRFASLDALLDRCVTVDSAPDAYAARGIDENGALLVERAGTQHRITAGTVRPTSTARPL